MTIQNVNPSRIKPLYDVVLVEKDGTRAINICIGNNEAENLAVSMDSVQTIRPLTHDIFHKIMVFYGLSCKDVVISKFLDGNYYADVTMTDSGGVDTLFDMRPSDALNLATRFQCPIYAADNLLDEVGFDYCKYLEDNKPEQEENDELCEDLLLERLQIGEIEQMLQDAVENEEYELASLLRDLLKHRQNNDNEG